MPKRPLADGALELLLLGVPAFIPKRPFVDGALDVVLLEDPNPEKPVVPVDVPLDASLFAVVPKESPVELAFEMLSLGNMTLEPNKPPSGVAFETSLLEDLAFELKRAGDGVLDVSLLEDTRLKPEKPPAVDEGFVAPNELLVEGDWVDALLPEGVEFVPNRPLPGDDRLEVPNRGPLFAEELKKLPVLTARVLAVRFVASGEEEDNESKLKVFEPLVASAVLLDDSVFF